ncbi:fimbrillin family protein, partial [Akkermansia sp. BIOML-A63]
MIKSIERIVCGALLLAFLSCGDDAGETGPAGGRGLVTFTATAGDTGTRSTQEGTFEKGNAIGVFAVEPKTGVYWAVNNKYIYDGGTFRPATAADNIIVTAGTDFDFYVYYPFREGQTDITAISHAIGDQDEKSGWLSADFLTASYTDVIQDYTIPLHFEHRLSTVEVRVEGSDGVDGARMENVKYGSRFNLLTGKTVTDETRGSYAMYRYSSGNLTTVFRMTIPAQILTTTSNYITLTGTPDMKLRGTSDMTTEPGRIHNYRIDYKIRITVLDYPQGGSTTGAGLYDLGGTCTVAANVNGGYEFAGWYEDGRIVSN